MIRPAIKIRIPAAPGCSLYNREAAHRVSPGQGRTPVSDDLPTPRSISRTGFPVRLGVGDVPLVRLRYRCGNCGSRLTEFIVGGWHMRQSIVRNGPPDTSCHSAGLDDFRHGHAEVAVVDHHHRSACDQAVVGVDIDYLPQLSVHGINSPGIVNCR